MADGRQDRRRQGRPGDQGARSCPSHSGAPTCCCRRTRRSRTCCRARRTGCSRDPRSTCRASTARNRPPRSSSEVTEVLMAAVTVLLDELRGEKAPATLYDPRQVRIEQRRKTAARDAAHTREAENAGTATRTRCRRPSSAPAPGARPSPWCSPTPGARSPCGVAAPKLADAVNSTRTNPDYLPGIELPATSAPPATRPRPPADAEFVSSPCLPDAARQSRRLGAAARPRRRAGQPDEGRRTRHREADERGHRGCGQGRPRSASPCCHRPQPGPARSPPGMPAASVVACRDEAVAQRLQAACHTAVLPPVHQHRRGRLRTRRRGQERHRARRRHRRRHGPGRQRQGAR